MEDPKKEGSQLILRDRLAIDRTKLANERTFLAYFRTSIIFLGTGISITQIQFFEEVVNLGWGLIILSPVVLGVGIYRLIKVRRNILKKVYNV